MHVHLAIHGYLVGNIWMPNAECYKDLRYDVTREAARMDGATLRDHVLSAINDGDFQSCQIADGVLVATVTKQRGASVITRRRYFDLARFPSIADCVRTDWDGPSFDA